MERDRKMLKKITYTADEWIARLKTDLPEDYQIGLHQVGVFGTNESIRQVRKNDISTYFRTIKSEDFCKSIVKSGLKNRWDNISYTLSTYGSVEEIANNKDSRREYFLQYDYNNDLTSASSKEKDLYDIVVAMPLNVNIGKHQYFLGYLEYTYDEKYTQDKGCKLFNGRDIPKEFIYGYIHKHHGKFDFTPNVTHFSKMTKEEQEIFVEGFVQQSEINIKSLQVGQSINIQQGNKTSKIANLHDLVKEEPTPDELEINRIDKKLEPQGKE